MLAIFRVANVGTAAVFLYEFVATILYFDFGVLLPLTVTSQNLTLLLIVTLAVASIYGTLRWRKREKTAL